MFTKSENHNVNYLATVTTVKNLRAHPNADRMRVATILGCNVITGLNTKENDLVVFFPLETCISTEFLSYTNSFEDKTLNRDTTIKGYFSSKNRVRAISLRGSKCEGYIVPVAHLEAFAFDVLGKNIKIDESFVNWDFDTIFDHLLVKKYIPANQRIPNVAGGKTKGNIKKYISKLVENQFRFHPSTEQLKRNIDKLSPNDIISLDYKIHGTSFVASNLLTKKKLNWRDKLAKFIGANVVETEYGLLYSSRSVLKNSFIDDGKNHNHFYDEDVWGIVANKVYPLLKQGITVYGEIAGYTKSGAFIQKPYDYGCNPGELDYWIYRMTYTNPNGDVMEFSHHQIKEYCQKYGMKMPHTEYYGYAKDLFPELDTENRWHENFLEKFSEKYLEQDCFMCKGKLPAEGWIIRIHNTDEWKVFKNKSFAFLQKESAMLDEGVADMETEESDRNDI